MSSEPFGLVSTLTTNLYFNKENTNRLLVGTGKSEALKFATYNGDNTLVDLVNLDSSANQVDLLVPTNVATSLVVKGAEASLDTDASASLNIGSSAATINIGNSGSVVNIKGTVNSVETTNTEIKDALITLNKGGATASASGSGLEFEEAGEATAYLKISTDRKSYDLKAPAQSTVTSFDDHGIQIFADATKQTTVMSIKEQSGQVIFTTDGHPSVHLDLDHTGPCDIVTTLGAQSIQGVKTFVDNTVVSSTTNPASLTDQASLAVAGGATIGKKLFVGQDAKFAEKVIVDDTLEVTGQTTLNALAINGSMSLNSDLTVAGTALFGSGITADAQSVFANVRVSSTFESAGQSIFTGTHQVDGPAVFNNSTTIDNTLSVTGQTTFGGESLFQSDVSIDGDLSMPSSLITSNSLNTNTATVSNTLTAGNIYSTGDFVSNVLIDGVKRSEIKNLTTGLSHVKKNASDVKVGEVSISDSTTAISRYDSTGLLKSSFTVNDSTAEVKADSVSILADSAAITASVDITLKTESLKATLLLNDSTVTAFKRNDQNMIVGSNAVGNEETALTRGDADGNLKTALRLKSTGVAELSSTSLAITTTDATEITAKNFDVSCSESVEIIASQGIVLGGGDVAIQQSLDVTGDITVSGTATISLDAECKEKLVVSSTYNPSSLTDAATALAVSGGATIAKKLFVGQDAKLGAKLDVQGDATMAGKLTVADEVTMQSSLNVSQGISTNGSFNVYGGALFHANTTTSGNSTVNGDFTATQTSTLAVVHILDVATLDQSLTVSGATTLASNLAVATDKLVVDASAGRVDMNSNVYIANGKNLSVGGTMAVVSAATLSSTLDVSGALTAQSTLAVTDDATFSADVSVSGLTTSGSLAVTGASTFTGAVSALSSASFADSLSVTGAASFASTADVTGDLKAWSTFQAVGAASVGSLSVASAASLSSTLAVTGAATFSNSLTASSASITNSLSAGTLSVGSTSQFTGDATFSADAHFSADADIAGDLAVTGALSGASTLAITGASTFADDVNVRSGLLQVQGLTSTVSVGGKLYVSPAEPGLALEVQGSSTFADDVTMNTNLVVVGNTVIDSQLYVGNNATVSGNINVSGTSNPDNMNSVAALKTMGGAVIKKKLFVGEKITAEGDLEVSGAVTLHQGMDLTGSLATAGDLSVAGNSSLSGTLSVAQNVSFGSSLTVAQDTALSGDLDVTHDATIGGTLDVTGAFSAASATISGTVSGRSLTISEDSELQGDLHVSGLATIDGKTVVNSDLIFKGPKFEGGIAQVTGSEQHNVGIWSKNYSYKDAQKKGFFVTENDGIRILDQATGSVVISSTSTDNQNEGQIGIDQGKVAIRHYYNTVDDVSAGNTTSGVVCIDSDKNVFNRYDKDAKLRSQLFQDDSMHAVYKFDSAGSLKGGLTMEDEKSLFVRSSGSVLNAKVEINNDGTLKAIAQNQIEITAPCVSISGETTVTGDATFASPVTCQSTALFEDDVTFSNPAKTFSVSSNAAFGGKVALSSTLNPGNSSDISHAAFYCAGGAIVEKDLYTKGAVYNPTTQLMAISSDKRVKEQIVDANLDDCLQSINSIKLRNFNYTTAYAEEAGVKKDTVQLGVIADEFLVSHPESVLIKEEVKVGDDTFKDFKTVNLSRQMYELIGCIQRLSQRIEELEKSKQ